MVMVGGWIVVIAVIGFYLLGWLCARDFYQIDGAHRIRIEINTEELDKCLKKLNDEIDILSESKIEEEP